MALRLEAEKGTNISNEGCFIVLIKRIVLVKRRPGMSKEDFVEHYLTQHAPLAKSLPGIRRYVVNLSIGDDNPFDAVAEHCFDDLESYNKMQTTPQRELTRQDEPKFMDMRNIVSVTTEEHIIL